jgi:hypothetical protein
MKTSLKILQSNSHTLMLYMDLSIWCHQAYGCNGNALDLFLRDGQFESGLGQWLS